MWGQKLKIVEDKRLKYIKPEIKKLGSLKKLTQTSSNGGSTDGGGTAANKHMCLTPPSSLEEHRILLKDSSCQNAYREQIFRHVKEGDVVCDLGTGSGIHTLFALMAGAKKVYAIDSHPLIDAAKQVIAENGFSDRVEFVHGYSRDINLPEKVDVLISNIGFLHTVNDLPEAVARFLKPGGRVLPDQAALTLVPVQAEDLYRSHVENWSGAPYGLKFGAFRKMAANHPIYWELDKKNMISNAVTHPVIDFRQEVSKLLVFESEHEVNKSAEMHGVGGWYSFIVNGEEFLSTKPPMMLSRELWQNFVFPLESALLVKKGDVLKVRLEMHREMIGSAPIWRWEITLNGKLVTQQSSFAGVPIDAIQ